MQRDKKYFQRLDRERREISRGLRISQSAGYFFVPENIKERRVIRYWLDNLCIEKVPLVVEEENYIRESAMIKLVPGKNYGVQRNVVQALQEYRLIRPESGSRFFDRTLLSNLSLAQTISWAFESPIEEVLLSEEYLQSIDFKRKDPRERVRTLFNAYSGAHWFERFRKKYKRRRSNQKFNPWHNISLRDLPEMLCTSGYEPHDPNGNLTKLVNAGLIIPKTRFRRFSSRNFVDVEALIELASLSTERPREKLTNRDAYINYIARKFIEERLIPHIRKTDLRLDEDVTLKKARQRTGKDSEVLCKVLRIKPNRTKRFYSSVTMMKGIDLALYELKDRKTLVFTRNEAARLFGMENIDLERCNIHPNSNGTYPRNQRIFPFYDSVGEVVKRMLFKDPSEEVPVEINGKTYYITQRTIKSYTKVYDLERFDENCMEHLMRCLTSGTRDNGKIVSRDLIFNLRGSQISSVEINIDDYIGETVGDWII